MRWIMLLAFAATPLCTFADDKAQFREAVQALTDVFLAEGMFALEARTEAVPPARRLRLLNGVLSRVYWTERDIAAVLEIGERTLAIGEAAHGRTADRVEKRTLRERLGPVHYNIASYTWPGWGGEQAGITLNSAQIERGRIAAHANVALRDALESEPRRRSGSRWMAAAHEMAAGNDRAALALLAEMRAIAGKSELGQEDWIRGWELVTRLTRGADPAATQELGQIVARMSQTKKGASSAGQFGVALRALAATPCATLLRCTGPDCSCDADAGVE